MLISIVTPSYNQADYLEQTMLSVLNQGYPELQYVIIDAGSSDSSLEIIKKYESQLSCWISEPDRGHADGINKGFAQTTGEIMGWINSSDIYYPWTLQTVADVFRDVPEAQWITGVATHLDVGIAPQNIRQAKWNIYDFLAGHYRWIQQESVFWRRSLWEASGECLQIEVKHACDFELWLRFMRISPLYHVSTILGGFRYHDCRRASIDNYSEEAQRYFDVFKRSASIQQRTRARLIKMTTNSPTGTILKKWIRKLGLWSWYTHPIIVRDFTKHRWIVSR